MRAAALTFALLLGLLLAADQSSRAAQDVASTPSARNVELLVFEHADCQFCRVFRNDVLPRYRENGQAARAPVRFVSIEHTDTRGLNLHAGIHMVPTFVLMQDGQEVGRIVGYWAPENFFKMISNILAKTEG